MFEYEKSLIGHLIKYYREAYHLLISSMYRTKSIKIKEYCNVCDKTCRRKENVCSHTSYKNVEKGEVLKNDCCYIHFAFRLRKEYQMTQEWVHRLQRFVNEVLAVISTKKKEEIQNIRCGLMKFSKEVENYLYFDEMVHILIAVCDYEYENKYCDEKLLEIMELLLPFFNLHSQKVVVYYLFKHYLKQQGQKFYDYLKLGREVYPENASFYYFWLSKEYSAKEEIEILKQMELSTFNGADLFLYYQALGLAYLKLDQLGYVLACLDECLDVGQKEGLIDLYIYQTYMRKGLLLYKMQKYEEASVCWLKVFEFDPNILLLNLMYLMDCLEKTGKQSQIKQLLTEKKYTDIQVDMIKPIYRYYFMKYHAGYSNEELKDCIAFSIKPYLKSGSAYEKMMQDELYRLSLLTKSYKHYRIFSGEVKEK